MAAARRAGSPGAAQCKSSLTTRPSTPDGGSGAASAHLGDAGAQPKRMSLGALWEGQLWAHQGRDGKQPSHHEDTKEPRQTPFRKEFRAQMDAAGRSHGRRRSPTYCWKARHELFLMGRERGAGRKRGRRRSSEEPRCSDRADSCRLRERCQRYRIITHVK